MNPWSLEGLLNTISNVKTMQKVINALALISFGVSAVVVAGGVYIYQNKEAIQDNIKEQVINAATSGVTDALPGMLGGSSDGASESPVPISLPVSPF
jgi:hypothetical protein